MGGCRLTSSCSNSPQTKKRKRSQTDLDAEKNNKIESKQALLTPFNQCTKRRKISSPTNSKKKSTNSEKKMSNKKQKNNLLSFLSPAPKKEIIDLISPVVVEKEMKINEEDKENENAKSNQSSRRRSSHKK